MKNPMINKLRVKFVLVSTISVLAVLVVMFSVLAFTNFRTMDDKMNQLVSAIENNGGNLYLRDGFNGTNQDGSLSAESYFDTRYFIVYFDDKNLVTYSNLNNIFSISAEEAKDYTTRILTSNKFEGYIDNYKYRVTNLNYLNAIIFVDASREIEMVKSSMFGSIVIFAVVIILTLIFSYLFSGRAISPIVDAYEKQKRFITDASHEIKTPLTVISANMDILEMQYGENKWVKNTSSQVTRLTSLVNNLTTLAGMQEQEKINREEFSLSEISTLAAQSFQAVADSANKDFHYSIQDDINFYGDEAAISQLLYIALDNSIKYSQDFGRIDFTLNRAHGKILIQVSNTASGIEKGDHSEFFDRFYKQDSSREIHSNSFGIGLSLASKIVQSHNGNIKAFSTCDDNFTLNIEFNLKPSKVARHTAG